MEISGNYNNSFMPEVKLKSHQPIELCYQCQKCASDCTMVEHAEYAPNQILRMIQMGMKEKALNNSSIWLCTSCEICGVRCPNGINIAEVMDALREIADHSNMVKDKNINLFNHLFLKNIRSMGRLNETFLMVNYKIRSHDLFSDMDLGLKMFKKGKLPIFSKTIKEKGKFKNIFDQCTKDKN